MVMNSLNYHRKTNKMRSVEERREFIIKTMPHVLNLPSRLEVDDYLNRIAEISGFSYDILFDMYKSEKKKLDREKSIVSININEVSSSTSPKPPATSRTFISTTNDELS